MLNYLLLTALFITAGFQAGNDTQATAPERQQESKAVSVIRVEEAISPTTTNYISRGISRALENGSVCLIIELDTPGGLLESTKNIVQIFFDAEIPIVVYVSPDGARAASAGTFITMAAHIAAMAPSTTIGAASPVTMGPGGGSAQTDTVMQKKIFNYSESFIESIAERRNRNKEWAISAVREGESVTEKQALELNVIDFIAEDREDLLLKIDGRVVEGDTLATRNATITEIPRNLAEHFFGFIIRPEVMLILTLIAIYGIIGEVSNPGAIVPGTAGVIALILLLYASAAMPINIAGFVLIVLAIILFVAEAFTPTFGLLIAGGAISFFLGALMLFQDLPEPMELSWAWLVPATILTTVFFVWIVSAGIKAQLTGTRTGSESMIGKRAEVIDKVDEKGGRVFISGEYWNAYCNGEIKKGEYCEVEAMEGLTLKVRPVSEKPPESSST